MYKICTINHYIIVIIIRINQTHEQKFVNKAIVETYSHAGEKKY